jgi:hypothetical protein
VIYSRSVIVHNVHERRFPAPPADVGRLVDSLSSPGDLLWPGIPDGRWPPMRLDRPLAVGARGGHAAVRYHVVEYVPGRRVVFEFLQQGLTRGLVGRHFFEVSPADRGSVLRHVIDARCTGLAALRWRAVIEPLHDALLEDALDRAERHLTGGVERPVRWSGWVRFLVAVFELRARSRTVRERRRSA